MKYTDGEPCRNNINREASVSFLCGLNNYLFSVDEPETCNYRLLFKTPLVCNEKDKEEKKNELLKRINELQDQLSELEEELFIIEHNNFTKN